MMRGQNHFDSIKSFVDFSYKSFGNSLSVSQKPFNPISPELGYCFTFHRLALLQLLALGYLRLHTQ